MTLFSRAASFARQDVPFLFLDSGKGSGTSYLYSKPQIVLTERDGRFVELAGGQSRVVDDPSAWLIERVDDQLHWAGMLGFEFAWALDSPRADRAAHALPSIWAAGFEEVERGTSSAEGPAPIQGLRNPRLSVSDDTYRERVIRCIDAIWRGELFEVNYTERFVGEWSASAWELYEALRATSTGDFFGFLNADGFAVASVSPEEFLRIEGGDVVTRPIKGTRRRGATPEEDEVLREELRTSAKDRAENIMIVDLMRNDLTRFSVPGSVEAAEICAVESFSGVHHLVSTVQSRLADDVTPIEALMSAFPAGSITGAPKLRTIELIAEIEENARGPYTGSFFRVGPDFLSSSVLIRTAAVVGERAEFGAGGAVVSDSNPDDELAEAYTKARAFLSLGGRDE